MLIPNLCFVFILKIFVEGPEIIKSDRFQHIFTADKLHNVWRVNIRSFIHSFVHICLVSAKHHIHVYCEMSALESLHAMRHTMRISHRSESKKCLTNAIQSKRLCVLTTIFARLFTFAEVMQTKPRPKNIFFYFIFFSFGGRYLCHCDINQIDLCCFSYRPHSTHRHTKDQTIYLCRANAK